MYVVLVDGQPVFFHTSLFKAQDFEASLDHKEHNVQLKFIRFLDVC